jgi:hypothetical protein
MSVGVTVEVGARRVFASALDWPGWCRAGKTEDAALDALARAAPRYGVVVAAAGLKLPARAATRFDVVERLPGDATTDFGAPGAIGDTDRRRVTPKQAERLAALVDASWKVLADVATGAPPTLRKGPRGGGRDRDQIVAHVLDAEGAYARKIGVRGIGDPDERRAAMLAVLGRRSDGAPLAEKGWPQRYAARRIAWHALDHAWEIEDKSDA